MFTSMITSIEKAVCFNFRNGFSPDINLDADYRRYNNVAACSHVFIVMFI